MSYIQELWIRESSILTALTFAKTLDRKCSLDFGCGLSEPSGTADLLNASTSSESPLTDLGSPEGYGCGGIHVPERESTA